MIYTVRRRIWIGGWFLCAALPIRAQQVPRAISDSGPAPTVFGPGVLSVGEVYRGSFAGDGRAFYFFKKTGKGEEYRIFLSRFERGEWSVPQPVDLGGDYSDLYPSVSRDGRRLVFTSYRPFPNDTAHTAHLWYADRAGEGWGKPVPAPGNLPGYYHSWAEIGRDGAIYFRRTSPDWRSTETLVAPARPDGGGYLPPIPYEALGEAKRVRPDLNIAGASPGPDGRTAFLDVATRDSVTGRRGSDIWVMALRESGWSLPRKLDAAINTPGYDVFPFFSPDGDELFFVRDFRTFYRTRLGPALEQAR